MEKRMISTEFTEEDMPIESSLRPMALADYIGQEKVKKNLKVYIEEKRAIRSSAVIWTPWTWKDHIVNYSGK